MIPPKSLLMSSTSSSGVIDLTGAGALPDGPCATQLND
jgi:hypothetical protein